MMMGRTGPRSLSVGVAAEVLLCLDVQLYADVDVVEVTCHPHRLQVGVLNAPLLSMVVSHHASVAEERKGPPDHEELLQKMFGGVIVDGSGACVPGQVLGHEDNDRNVGGGVEEGFLGAGGEEGNVEGGASSGAGVDDDVGLSPAASSSLLQRNRVGGRGGSQVAVTSPLKGTKNPMMRVMKNIHATLETNCAIANKVDNDGTNDEEDMSVTIARGRVGALRTFGAITTAFDLSIPALSSASSSPVPMADAAMGDGYTINDDLRAQGLHGDDEDDAGVADAADPLLGAGASAATPVDVDASPTNSTAGKRSRKRTSDVWKEMEELTRKDPVTGKQNISFIIHKIPTNPSTRKLDIVKSST
ncbi:hypothetical protein PR202_ga13991 [Eleusine coracana subsp. coracana]|uniref:Uncharacterized protein n=1 Tax=Eleusine coracana subsp. coracana TaxID=191504 RepID=A0AAV5CG54_ELECO|nr:hypothetical protein PR202_ga13991 [Eleusine coracana subsp. coracana]